jgi:hypothetical protein
MLILWIRKSRPEKDNNPGNKKDESFKKHDEEMKKFRQDHPQNEPVDAVEFITPDGGLLAPVVSVKMGENAQN